MNSVLSLHLQGFSEHIPGRYIKIDLLPFLHEQLGGSPVLPCLATIKDTAENIFLKYILGLHF